MRIVDVQRTVVVITSTVSSKGPPPGENENHCVMQNDQELIIIEKEPPSYERSIQLEVSLFSLFPISLEPRHFGDTISNLLSSSRPLSSF
jgi:hypothetical protein